MSDKMIAVYRKAVPLLTKQLYFQKVKHITICDITFKYNRAGASSKDLQYF